jgi:predicted RNase H-like HicB family nuclease
MREINIVFKQIQFGCYTATIREMPEVELTGETLQEVQAQIFNLVPMLMEKCFQESRYKVNIMLSLSVPKA